MKGVRSLPLPLPILENLDIATPCTASWEDMPGTDRVRHCGSCDLDVFNLSGMTRVDAQRLIMKTNGRVCVRLYKRHDGTVITQDCPTAISRARRRVAMAAMFVFSIATTALAGVLASGFSLRRDPSKPDVLQGSTTIQRLVSVFSANAATPTPHRVMMGGPMLPTMGTPRPIVTQAPRTQAKGVTP